MAAYPCSDDPQEVIESILEAQDNAELFDKFVNGGVLEEVQLGVGEPTPTLRNLSHLVKSAAATLDGSDVSGKFSDAANGGTSLRMLADRFGDIVNVKDFGAIGDGLADDTAAFAAWNAASGGVKYIPSGSYLVDGVVLDFPEGMFFDSTKETSLKDVYIHPALCQFGAVCIGADRPNIVSGDITAWDGTTQSAFVDPFDMVLYVTRLNSQNQSKLIALRWSEKESERIFLSQTSYDTYLGHQNNSIYRPNKASLPLFFAPRPYRAPDRDPEIPYSVRVLKWNRLSESNFTLVREFTLFDSTTHTPDQYMRFCISYDMRYMIAEATRISDSKRIVRVWDVAKVLASSSNDCTASYEWEFVLPDQSVSANQGIYSDGKYIYYLSGQYVTYITCVSIDGSGMFSFPQQKHSNEAYAQYRTIDEPEGLFWAPWKGRTQMFLHICAAVYDREDDSQYTRRDSFFCLSIPSSPSPVGTFHIFKGLPKNSDNVADFNEAVEPGLYFTQADDAHSPAGNAGYLQVFRHINDTWNKIQLHFGRGSATRIHIRWLVDESSFGDWKEITFAQDSNRTRYGSIGIQDSNLVKGTRPEAEADRNFIFFYDSEGTAVKNRLATIRQRVGAAGDNTSRLEFQVYDFTHNAETIASCSLVLANNDELSFRPSSDDALHSYILGSTNRRWDNIFAVTSTIGESDQRSKDNISDISEGLMRAWGRVNFKVFQFKDAVKKKGADNARIHVGCIAQEIEQAFASEGLDARRFGLFCYDEWDDEWESKKVVDVEAVLDENGNVVEQEQSHVERKLVVPAGSKYSLRYEECLALECAYQRWRLDRLEAQMRGGSNEADS